MNFNLNTFTSTLQSVVPVNKNKKDEKEEKIKKIVLDCLPGYSDVIIKYIAIEAVRREDNDILSDLKNADLIKMEWFQS